MDEDESQIELKHIFEGGNVSELFFFEISNSGVDLLPARSHIFHNSVFGKRRIIAEIAVALISYTLKVYIRCVRQVNEEQIFNWLEPLIGDCSITFQKRNVKCVSTAMKILGQDIDLLYRDIPILTHFGPNWCIYNLFLKPEGMNPEFNILNPFLAGLGNDKLKTIAQRQKLFQKTIKEKSVFKRLVQNQIPGSYRYQVIEAWNELVTTLKNPNYHKPLHIMVEGPAGLGKTQFFNKILEAQYALNETVVLYKESGKATPHCFNTFQPGLHKVVYDWEFNFSNYNIDVLKQFAEGSSISTRYLRNDPINISSRGVMMLFTTNCDVDSELRSRNIIGFRERFKIIKATKQNSPDLRNKGKNAGEIILIWREWDEEEINDAHNAGDEQVAVDVVNEEQEDENEEESESEVEEVVDNTVDEEREEEEISENDADNVEQDDEEGDEEEESESEVEEVVDTVDEEREEEEITENEADNVDQEEYDEDEEVNNEEQDEISEEILNETEAEQEEISENEADNVVQNELYDIELIPPATPKLVVEANIIDQEENVEREKQYDAEQDAAKIDETNELSRDKEFQFYSLNDFSLEDFENFNNQEVVKQKKKIDSIKDQKKKIRRIKHQYKQRKLIKQIQSKIKITNNIINDEVEIENKLDVIRNAIIEKELELLEKIDIKEKIQTKKSMKRIASVTTITSNNSKSTKVSNQVVHKILSNKLFCNSMM